MHGYVFFEAKNTVLLCVIAYIYYRFLCKIMIFFLLFFLFYANIENCAVHAQCVHCGERHGRRLS